MADDDKEPGRKMAGFFLWQRQLEFLTISTPGAGKKEDKMKFSFSMKGKHDTTARYKVLQSRTGDRTTDPQWELYKVLLQAFPEGAFYQQPAAWFGLVRDLIRQNDPAFAARLAVYLRETVQLRSLPFALTAELAAIYKDAEWTCHLAGRVIREAGDLPEWLDYYSRARGMGPWGSARKLRLPARLRKSLAPLFSHLEEYRYSRYSRDEQLKIQRALALVRPSADGKVQQLLFDRIRRDAIPVRSTWASEWEALQHQSYDSPELRSSMLRDKWKEGISSFRIGYPALLENLQPILAAGVSGKILKLAAEYIGNAAAAGSRPSPLRLLAAYRKLKGRREGGVPLLLEALEQAAVNSARQLAGFGEQDRVVIAMDVSNSMKQPLKEGTGIQRYDVGPLLALLLRGRTKSLVAGIIGNTWNKVDLDTPGILSGVDPFHRREGEAGYAINAPLVIQDLLKKGQVVDKVMIFTDCSLWDSRPFNQPEGPDLVRVWNQYRRIAPQAKLCLFDLAGYGSKPLEALENGVCLVAGWQDRIFDVLNAVEDREATLETINYIVL